MGTISRLPQTETLALPRIMAGLKQLAVACLAAVPIFFAAPTPVFAQAPSADQLLKLFNSLPPDQQQRLMEQLAGGLSGAAGGKSPVQQRLGAQGPQNENESSQTENENPRSNANNRKPPVDEGLLRPLDTVLINVDFLKPKVLLPNSPEALVPPDQQANGAHEASSNQQPVVGSGLGVSPVVIPPPELEPEEREKVQDLIELIRARNPYRLDRNGALLLPGLRPIALAGLTEELATKRLAAEPALQEIDISLTRLPLTKSGAEALQPFGYDMFQTAPSTFAPSTDVPVPNDYIVGPGDVFDLQLYGSQNLSDKLIVSRDGFINFPEMGPISVGGRQFSQVRSELESRVAKKMIGVFASISMGEVRSIRVFVVGEVNYPGAYTISGLATMTGALYASGGINSIGSFRKIELNRQGRTVRQLDLYDLLMRGDTSNDANVQAGDVIFVPPVGPTASVEGEIQRPAIYEFKGSVGVAELIAMAGGFTTEADTGRAELTRVDSQRRRVVMDIDPSAANGGVQNLRNGDALRIARLRPTLDSGVTVQGEVFRPGAYAWHEGLRVTDVIGSVNELKPGADEHYLLIRRELPPDRRIAVLSADLAAALRDPTSAANVLLMPRDQITAFDLESGREHLITSLMTELQVQSSLSNPAQVVKVSGRVNVPGDYPLEAEMRVADLIRAGGGLHTAAYSGQAELSRHVIENGQIRQIDVIQIDLAAALRNDPAANLVLQPYDSLFVKELSGWSKQEMVTLAGEVQFPGIYPIVRGETLRSVIQRAGGLTDLAFLRGGVFMRKELREREQNQLNQLADRLQKDVITASMMASRGTAAAGVNAAQTVSLGQSLLSQLKAAKAVGRLVINLPAAIAATPGSANDIILRDGDSLVIPKQNQEVTVLGEVQNTTSHLYQVGLTRGDYIALSGGTTREADLSKTYVVRADGSVIAGGGRWHFGKDNILPGDAIVVPLNTEKVPALPFWGAVTTILYNIAVAFAAVHTL